MNLELRTSKIVTITLKLLAVVLIFNDFVNFLFFGTLLLLYAFWIGSMLIKISYPNAKYSAWFRHKTIKDIESISVDGFWLLNSVEVTGRGGVKMKIFFVPDIKNIKRFVDEHSHT